MFPPEILPSNNYWQWTHKHTLGPAYNEHFDAKKIARCKWVLIVAELIITGVLLVVQYSYQDVILSNLMLTTH